MKKSYLSAILLPLLAACATTLPPREQRTVQYIEQTKAPATQSYDRAVSYFAKSLGDSNRAIKVQNRDQAQVIMKGKIQCNVLRHFGDVNDYNLSFDLDFQAKENRVRLSFEDLTITDKVGGPVMWADNQITGSPQVEKAKECLEPIREGVMRSIAGSTSQSW